MMNSSFYFFISGSVISYSHPFVRQRLMMIVMKLIISITVGVVDNGDIITYDGDSSCDA